MILKRHLHSIMYLLIRILLITLSKSGFYLHSIMYLLILNTAVEIGTEFSFTFHNVSINSKYPERL